LDSCGHLYQDEIGKTSAFYVMLYSWIFLVILDSPVLAWFLLCFSIKTASVLSYVLCPLKFLAFQKDFSRRYGFCWMNKRPGPKHFLTSSGDVSEDDDDPLYN
jgi:hypothetical protein